MRRASNSHSAGRVVYAGASPSSITRITARTRASVASGASTRSAMRWPRMSVAIFSELRFARLR